MNKARPTRNPSLASLGIFGPSREATASAANRPRTLEVSVIPTMTPSLPRGYSCPSRIRRFRRLAAPCLAVCACSMLPGPSVPQANPIQKAGPPSQRARPVSCFLLIRHCVRLPDDTRRLALAGDIPMSEIDRRQLLHGLTGASALCTVAPALVAKTTEARDRDRIKA